MNFIGIKGGRFWGFDGKMVRPLNGGIGRIPACGRKGRQVKNNIFPEGPTFYLPALYHVRGQRISRTECTDEVHFFYFYTKEIQLIKRLRSREDRRRH
jgi:hypothetical protein